MDWKNILYKIGNVSERNLDVFKLKFRERLGLSLPVQLCPYITYGHSEEIFVKGRLLSDRSLVSHTDDSLLENLVNSYKRLASEEIAGASLRLQFSNTEYLFSTDEDGYFEFTLPLNTPLPKEQLWHYPVIELLDSPVAFQRPLIRHGRVMTPPSTSQFGIISDIDDTILPTDATDIFKMAYYTFAKNQFSRLPFKGVGSLYRGLQKGVSGENYNPFFYVSSSPWNLYDLLVDFMKVNKIPSGPLMLKDYGFTHNKLFSEGHHAHKLKMIRNIFNSYPQLNFILIGDSGQQDPEIYLKIVREFPSRVLAIYIRDVSSDRRDAAVNMIAKEIMNETKLVLCEDSLAAAMHAATNGFLNHSVLPFIQAEVLS